MKTNDTTDDAMRIDLIINDPNFTDTGIIWQGTFGELLTEAEVKRLGDPDQLVIIRRVFPDKAGGRDDESR